MTALERTVKILAKFILKHSETQNKRIKFLEEDVSVLKSELKATHNDLVVNWTEVSKAMSGIEDIEERLEIYRSHSREMFDDVDRLKQNSNQIRYGLKFILNNREEKYGKAS